MLLGSGTLLLGLVVTIIAGLMFATGLTMIVVPTLYAIFYKVREEPPA